MMPIPRESWIVLATAGGGLAVVQTARLWWRAAAVRWRLAEQSARAAAGEEAAEKLLRRAGYRIEARQATQKWSVAVDGTAQAVALRADFVVARRRRRYVAEVKTGAEAPDVAAQATRRQLLEYRCAFGVDGVLLVDAEARRVHEIGFALPAAPSAVRAIATAFVVGVVVGVALVLALAARPAFGDTTAPKPRPGEAQVTVTEDRIAVAEPIAFDAGKATVKQASLPALDAVAAAVRATPALALVEIGVHSDARGAEAWNLRLTQARADAIRAYLIAHGVAPERLRARGYGESKPLCSEANEACWAKNRRVEFVVVRRS